MHTEPLLVGGLVLPLSLGSRSGAASRETPSLPLTVGGWEPLCWGPSQPSSQGVCRAHCSSGPRRTAFILSQLHTEPRSPRLL